MWKYIFLGSVFINFSCFAIVDVDVSDSNGWSFMDQYSIKFIDETDQSASLKRKLLTENYERLKPSITPESPTPIIPKIFHRIWLGSKEMPEDYKYYLNICRKYHPDWEVKLWTEEDVLKENFPNMDLYWKAESYAEQTDIARYEILNRYGGLYTDTDIECFSNFDDFHYKYDFYVSNDCAAINAHKINLANGIMGSIPNHPILVNVLNKVRDNWDKTSRVFEENYASSLDGWLNSKHHLAVQRTMYPLSDVVFDFLQSDEQYKYKSIVIPSGYNLPYYFNAVPNQKKWTSKLKKLLSFKSGSIEFSNDFVIRPETISFHYYGFKKLKSLMTKVEFNQSFLNRKIQDKYFIGFEKLFNINFPTNIEYSATSIIPEVIYLHNDKNLSKEKIADLENKWQKINPFVRIIILSNEELEQFLPEGFKLLDLEMKKLLSRFYLLHKNGGTYVSSEFEPANLQEFNYKYSFYGLFKEDDDLLTLDMSFIASKETHLIVKHIIEDFEKEGLNNISIKKIQDLYLVNVYNFYLLDGKNIIFPNGILNQRRQGIYVHNN